MFELIMRAQVKWFSGFGRYLDLFLGMLFLVLAWHLDSITLYVFAVIGLLSFIFDLNGRVQRWVLNSSVTRVRKR